KYENTQEAILQRKTFLETENIGICDIVESAEREKIDASDLGMQNTLLRDLIGYLKQYPNVDTLLFTGGNSKNGPEYFFRKHLKDHNLKLELVNNDIPRIHQFRLNERTIRTVSLTAPSGSANRAVGSMPLYQQLKSKNPEFTTLDFRVMQYSSFFK
ncbi:MAG: uracil-DNA glycosylase family protein, partial [Flavobacteriaceae bacterium]|nr:uracil-DNA glycosylase family protein [Flavobacteriaceae bacterium]